MQYQLLYYNMDLKEILSKNNKSFTAEREEMFNAIKNLHHFEYSKLFTYLKTNNISIWRASIFRTIKLFLEINIIKIISNKDWVTVYELEDEETHHEHMKCIKCLEIIEFDDSELHDIFVKLAKNHNFQLEKHSLTFEGLCENCK